MVGDAPRSRYPTSTTRPYVHIYVPHIRVGDSRSPAATSAGCGSSRPAGHHAGTTTGKVPHTAQAHLLRRRHGGFAAARRNLTMGSRTGPGWRRRVVAAAAILTALPATATITTLATTTFAAHAAPS